MALRVTIKEGYQPGRGLGPHLDGIPAPIIVQENEGKTGLGVNLRNEIESKEARLGKQMPPDLMSKLVELLKEYSDVFTWSYWDMPGLDCKIVEHKLPLLPRSIPVRQRLRRMRPEIALKIKEEWNAGFLAVSNYPQWVENIVLVPKKDGKVRMCVDYIDLNRASPKENFLLPHIDVLIDNTTQHAFFSFMDGFSGYNQIMMFPEDREKTTFITLWGTFCYNVMPFGLKNASATYQRAMVALFHDMIHKEIEVYMDDMITKSKTPKQHIEDLRKLFIRLRKYKLRLNPAKCTFGVKTGKLLGFVVKERGIEVDPDKVKAIREMPVPKIETGKLHSLIYLLVKATCNPIFKLLRKKHKLEWESECQEAFEKIKRCRENPPILVPTVPRKPLILYLTILEESMGCMLGQRDTTGKKEHALYYLSKKFIECEKRYSTLERIYCALVWVTKRLKQYMLAHTTWLVARTDPIKYIFEKLALTGRIARWQMALSEYDIIYVNRKVVKGSALEEHLAYHPLKDSQPLFHEFPDEHIATTISIETPAKNGQCASNSVGNGIGVVLASPKDQYFPFSAKLGFDCTNNMAEYEACTMGLLMALEYQVKKLIVFVDSALVIYQLRREWETRDVKLVPYHDHVREIVEAFDAVTFHHIPHKENQMADALATLSAMVQVNEGQGMTTHPREDYCQQSGLEIAKIDVEPWYFDIKWYLEKGNTQKELLRIVKRTLRRLASGFLLSGAILYKRNADMTFLRCVDHQLAKRIMEEVHQGFFGAHANGHTLVCKILRVGYY
ncbi:Retrovirus-related Pol polyprotein from transposon 17.6, partial [Mucuna pruriens]